MCVHHGWGVEGERQAAGGFPVALVALVGQAVEVVGQAGGGAHGVVPQHVDHVVQSVQTILHLRLHRSKPELVGLGKLARGSPQRSTASLALGPGELGRLPVSCRDLTAVTEH